ncbi:hypothetical protein M231_01418 [Tremella mesenterica]|uniref:Uncharacterized protein n=1 Tax=Tremella mesenterica TaxID=5217 RepID=A0A4Q1BTE8_TREME|nr:uncharacterized protein TREMEDRAFT_74695 [Tremella mesenterica DSM 1558]EIW66815.1 hypothetical protein TREMEDRAFT_74695 [Tremella mesenterica DSM 1558]RXK41268.1 hypothetical protein M231_01418 [Tremella mesenterica]
MVATRSKTQNGTQTAGEKRPAETETKKSSPSKKAKKGIQKLEVGDDGEVGLTKEQPEVQPANGHEQVEVKNGHSVEEEKEDTVEEPAEVKTKEVDESTKEKSVAPVAENEQPKHGTLEAGHIYFMYRPKVDAEEVESIDDVSKFHILLIPTSAPHDHAHFHRIISVGKKKMPDPGAKHQVIWGSMVGVGNDKSALKDAFGAYDYDTKTRGTRHQPAARPAARGHYILHSPQDTLADSPEHNRQRDYKVLLAYEITTPAAEAFGEVQKELGLALKDAVALQVKDPNADAGSNPRAASLPKEKRASYSTELQELFKNRRFIPANPPAFLSYTGTELLIISSPHELEESLGVHGDQVEKDLDEVAAVEKVGVEAALKELRMSKEDTEIEALEGAWV